MNDDIILTYEKIAKDIDAFYHGDESCRIVVTNALKDLKSVTRGYKMNCFIYTCLTRFNLLTAKIYRSESLNDPRYKEYIQECFELIKAYSYYMQILKQYLKEISKTKDYELLSEAYMYSLKVQTIFEMINDIYNMINRLDKSLYSSYSLLIPKNFLEEKEKEIITIDAMSKDLQRVNKKANN